jgi:hypothetical protein
MTTLLIIITFCFFPMKVVSQNAPNEMEFCLKQAEGIWGIDFQTEVKGTLGLHPTSADNFIYKDRHLTMRVLDISGMPDPKADGFLKLDTRWEGNALSYRAPSGKWESFAIFSEGIFTMHARDRIYTFKKIEPSEVAEWNQGLLREGRAAFKYAD